ncbi:MAG: porin [Ferrovibrio sp.]
MKRTLLLQTALVAAAGLMLADVANAQTKEVPLAATVGGYFTQFIKAQDAGNAQKSAGDSNRTTGLGSDAEIWFNIRGVLDNGTVVGGRVELEAATYGDQIDERYLFVEKADVGRIEIGATDRINAKMNYFAPTALPGHGTTTTSEYLAAYVSPQMWFANHNNDAEGINLYTASNRYFGSKAGKGLQLGFSYVPDGCEDYSATAGARCGNGFGSRSNTGQMSDQYAVAANFLESFGSVDAALYAGYNSVKHEGVSARRGREAGWQLGAQLSYNVGDGSAIQFGGGYSNEDVARAAVSGQGTIDDRDAYSVGLKYLTNGAAAGSIGIGVEFHNREDKLIGGGKNELDYYTLGLTYQVATGVLTFAGIGVSDYDANTNSSDNDQTFGVVGIGINF